MLNLIPVKAILSTSFILSGLAVLAAGYAGIVGDGNAFADAYTVMKYSLSAAAILPVLLYFGWRSSASVQSWIFPYLGGTWSGKLKYSGPRGHGNRTVRLDISHTLLTMKLVLDSKESTSSTLVVHAERDTETKRRRLYYAYLSERKEGVSQAGYAYRGLAIMRIEGRERLRLYGDYFTELGQFGTLSLSRKSTNPFWAFWK